MAADDNVGKLEEESLKRKERLKALKRKHEQPESIEETSVNENTKIADLPRPKFRSYRPQDENLKQQVIEDAKPGNVENEVKEQLEAANSKVVIEELDNLSEKTLGLHEEELEGEYVPEYVCIKEEEEKEICESETTSCSDAGTTSGNILRRMIKDATGRRPPCLGKWPTYCQSSESDFEENAHQFRAARQPNLLKQMCSLRVTSEPNSFRQPTIIGTIGPSSRDVDGILELIEAGMNVARISMAHVDPCSKTEPFRNIIQAANQYKAVKDYQIPIATMMDLMGPEIRTGKIDPNRVKSSDTPEILLKKGTYVRLTSEKIFQERCTDKIIYVNYSGLASQILHGNPIYICDGQIKLRVDIIENENLLCLVENSGILRNNQKVHIPMFPALLPALSDYDMECLQLAIQMEIDVVVVPMTRNSDVIMQVKKALGTEENDQRILVFAKISSFEGLENIDEILRVSDGIVIQKNDLSLEISPEKMIIAQKEIIGKCNRIGKPVFCTGELSSLKSINKTSRRTEISDIGGAIIDGADGIILINETATGNDGAQIISQLSIIMREAEAATMQMPFHFDLANELTPSIEPIKAIAMAAVQISWKIQASAILAVTTSGRTAQSLSWFRPRRPVIAITRVGRVARQMNLWRAVLPLHYTAPVLPDWFQDVKARFEYGISYGREFGLIESGDLLVLVSGFRKKSGFTDCIRIVFASIDPSGFADNVAYYYDDISRENSQN